VVKGVEISIEAKDVIPVVENCGERRAYSQEDSSCAECGELPTGSIGRIRLSLSSFTPVNRGTINAFKIHPYLSVRNCAGSGNQSFNGLSYEPKRLNYPH
jgi:hypothetical protein